MAQHRRKFGAEQGYDSERNLIKKHEENKEIALTSTVLTTLEAIL
jgi:hypothetical protein